MTAPLPPVYNPKIPENPGSSIGKDQINFLNNFSTLYDAFLVNHVALDASSGAGNHTIIELLEQENQFQTDQGEISFYSKLANGQSDQIFLRYQGNQTEFQYTNYQIYALEPTPAQIGFFTFLPGRILIYFGTIVVSFGMTRIFNMKLFPAIAKNIVSFNFCPRGAIPSFPPFVTIQQPSDDGIYSVLNLTPATTLMRSFPTQLDYFIAVNI